MDQADSVLEIKVKHLDQICVRHKMTPCSALMNYRTNPFMAHAGVTDIEKFDGWIHRQNKSLQRYTTFNRDEIESYIPGEDFAGQNFPLYMHHKAVMLLSLFDAYKDLDVVGFKDYIRHQMLSSLEARIMELANLLEENPSISLGCAMNLIESNEKKDGEIIALTEVYHNFEKAFDLDPRYPSVPIIPSSSLADEIAPKS